MEYLSCDLPNCHQEEAEVFWLSDSFVNKDDDLGRALAITDPFGNTVGYGYDGQSNRTRLTYADEKVVQYAYDNLNRLQTVTDWDNRVTGYTYDAAGRTHTVSLPNGVTSTYNFDAAGRLSSLAHHRGTTLLSNFQYSYDLSGNRLQAVEDVRQLVLSAGTGTPPGWTPPAQFAVEEAGYLAMTLAWPDAAIEEDGYTLERSTDGQHWIAVAELSANTLRYVDFGLARHTRYWYRLTAHNNQGSENPQTVQAETAAEPVNIGEDWVEGEIAQTVIDYQYDALYRLTEANYSDGAFFHYAYDSNGNRVSEMTEVGAVESLYDAANRLTSVGASSYTWDANGNLTNDGVRTYSYTTQHRQPAAWRTTAEPSCWPTISTAMISPARR